MDFALDRDYTLSVEEAVITAKKAIKDYSEAYFYQTAKTANEYIKAAWEDTTIK